MTGRWTVSSFAGATVCSAHSEQERSSSRVAGFEGSNEMLTQHLGGRAGDLPLIAPGLANNRGEGIRMAIEVGADTAGQFDMFHGEPVDPRASKPDPVFFPYVCGIVVNGRGERFFDEGRDSFDATFEALGYEIWRNQEQTAFFVGDQTTLGDRAVRAPSSSPTCRRSPPRSVEELAAQLGLDPSERSRAPFPSTTPPPVRSRSTRTSSTARARVASRRRSRTGPSRSTRRRTSRTRSPVRSRSPSAGSAPTARRGS